MKTHAYGKTAERFLALGFALIIIVTILGSVTSFMLSASVFSESLIPAATALVIICIVSNALSSLAVWIYGLVNLGKMVSKKAYALSGLAAINVFWDVAAILLAFFAFTVTPMLFVYLGITLVVDVLSDGTVHFLR